MEFHSQAFLYKTRHQTAKWALKYKLWTTHVVEKIIRFIVKEIAFKSWFVPTICACNPIWVLKMGNEIRDIWSIAGISVLMSLLNGLIHLYIVYGLLVLFGFPLFQYIHNPYYIHKSS